MYDWFIFSNTKAKDILIHTQVATIAFFWVMILAGQYAIEISNTLISKNYLYGPDLTVKVTNLPRFENQELNMHAIYWDWAEKILRANLAE